MADFPEYRGMSYEQASREAEHVIKTIGWYAGFRRLEALRAIMNADLARK